jgi:hypothetical protein
MYLCSLGGVRPLCDLEMFVWLNDRYLALGTWTLAGASEGTEVQSKDCVCFQLLKPMLNWQVKFPAA